MNELKLFIQNRRKLASFIGIILMILVLPLIIFLAGLTQTFFSKASGTWIQLADGNCVTTKSDGTKALKCGTVPLVLFNPFSGSTPNNPNLIKNGSFEDPVVKNTKTSDSWQLYGAAGASDVAVLTPIPNWEPRQPNAGYQVEIHHNLYGKSADGDQYAEVDQEGVNSLIQKIPTTAGKLYTLKFSYAPRPDVAEQKLGVYWNGQLVDTLTVSGNPSAPEKTIHWEEHSYTLQATAAEGALGFGSVKANGGGNFIDKVSVHEAAAGSCLQRHDIGRTTAMNAEGMLVTLTHAKSAALPNNQIQKIDFTSLGNGTVTVDGISHSEAFTYTVPAASTQIQFLIRQVAAGSATTIGLNAIDSCGAYPLTFGGGTGVVWPITPVPDAPTNFIVTSNELNYSGGSCSAGRVEIGLSWTVMPRATSYKVLRTYYGSTVFEQIGTPTESNYKDLTAQKGKLVLYRVIAVNATGDSIATQLQVDSKACPLVACQPPPDPLRPAFTKITGGIRVTRGAGTNANTPTNVMRSLNITGFANVRLDYNGKTYKANRNIAIPSGGPITFDVYLIDNNKGGTFFFDVVDNCRTIGDFVGSTSRSEFGTGAPPAELPAAP